MDVLTVILSATSIPTVVFFLYALVIDFQDSYVASAASAGTQTKYRKGKYTTAGKWQPHTRPFKSALS
jgi:hypothetical protein